MVFDHVALVGGIYNSDMSNKQVLLVCGSARQKYDVYLDKQKLLKTQAITAQKKKFFCEVEKLKRSLRLTRNHCCLLQITMLKRLNMVIS